MSARDPVREVAEEIADDLLYGPEAHALSRLEARLRSFLEERESAVNYWRRLAEARSSQLTAALSEAAGLRGALEAVDGELDDYWITLPEGQRAVSLLRSALDSPSPLSRAAAEVLEAAGKRRSAQAEYSAVKEGPRTPAFGRLLDANQAYEEALSHYLALLRGEGEEG